MAEAIYNLERDLSEAKALAENLLPYVYENELYGSIGGKFGSGKLPSLTIGGLLLRLHRLHALENQLSDSQKAQLSQIAAKNDEVYKEWGVHYKDKLVQEGNSRLKVIEHFIRDCDDEPRTCAGNYPPEASRRTIVEAIQNWLREHNAADEGLTNNIHRIDSKLRRVAPPGDFILARALEDAYPRDAYWWLYALPPRAT